MPGQQQQQCEEFGQRPVSDEQRPCRGSSSSSVKDFGQRPVSDEQQPCRGSSSSSVKDFGQRPVSDEQQLHYAMLSGSVRAFFESVPVVPLAHSGALGIHSPCTLEPTAWPTSVDIEGFPLSGDASPRGVAEPSVLEVGSADTQLHRGVLTSSVKALLESVPVDRAAHSGTLADASPGSIVGQADWSSCAETASDTALSDASSGEVAMHSALVSGASCEDIDVRAHDGETAITVDGFLVGPDGTPLLGAMATCVLHSDRELRVAIEASLCEPTVPFFSNPSMGAGPVEPAPFQPASACPSVQVQCFGSSELSASARKKQNRATKRSNRKALAALRVEDEHHRRKVRILALRSAKKARQRERFRSTDPAMAEFSIFVDSGAGETFVTSAVYQALGSPPLRGAIAVADVSNTVTSARGFGPLYVYAKNIHDEWVRVLLAKEAYTSNAFG